MVFHWILRDSKSSQVSWTLLNILANLNQVVVWIVSTHPLISKSSSPCTKPFMTVPSKPNAVGITVTFMFHSFFCSLARSMHLSLFLLSFSFTLWSAKTAKSTIWQVLFFLLSISYYYYYIQINWNCCPHLGCYSQNNNYFCHYTLQHSSDACCIW